MKKALILIAHGSKNKAWVKPLQNIYTSFKKAESSKSIQLSYLEFCRPTLEEAFKKAVKAGYKDILILPMFMANGNHTKRDIPQKINSFKKLNPKTKIKLLPAVGEHPEVMDLYKKLAKGYLKN